MQHTVHNHGAIEDFEVNPTVVGAKTVEGFAIPEDFTKAITIEIAQIRLSDLESIKQLELMHRFHSGDFCCADFVEDNL